MNSSSRRTFLARTPLAVAGSLTALQASLAQLGQAVAGEAGTTAGPIRKESSVASLVDLIRKTPRDQCIAAFVRELQAGLSYHDFLSALFLAAFEHGDPHQVAQVYAAHRVASEVRPADRLLPLFWMLDRIALGFEQQKPKLYQPLEGDLPAVNRSASVLEEAMTRQDPAQAERAIVAIAQAFGPRHAMSRLWRHGIRRVAGTLGHHPIMIANAFRTLDALNWEFADPVLRYLAASFSQHESDRAYEPNRIRVSKYSARLPGDWTAYEPNDAATLELYGQLRRGDSDGASDSACSMLAAGRVKAGAVWDAIRLTASDLIFRYKTGGLPIGSVLIHTVTSTNALHFAFGSTQDDDVRLLAMLQGIGALGDVFVAPAAKDNQLRDMNMLDLASTPTPAAARLEEIFARLPFKADGYTQKSSDERLASDEACSLAFSLLSDSSNHRQFMQTARALLCAKASSDPHDVKYPIAIFEDVRSASAKWQPYVLASSVHALHGSASDDSRALLAARAALTRLEKET
jgi:hypothetical protein